MVWDLMVWVMKAPTDYGFYSLEEVGVILGMFGKREHGV